MVQKIHPKETLVVLSKPVKCNFIKWDWMKCFVHFLWGHWQKRESERLQNGLNLRTLTLLYAGRPPVVSPVLNLDFCELELWPDADQNQSSLHPFFHVALHWLTRYCSNRYICIIIYSSPPQLRYPQLCYFCSYAILNWVQKNSS